MISNAERLLRLVGPIHIVGGLGLFAAGFSPAVLDVLEPLLVGNDDYVWSAFFVTVLGPTITSWGVLFGALVNQFYAAPSLTLWRTLILSVVVWAPLDSALCLRYGLTVGVIVNSIVVVALIGLLFLAQKSIR